MPSKNLVTAFNGLIAVFIFAVQGVINWPATFAMMLGALVGSQIGTRIGRYAPREVMRWVVIVIGVLLTTTYVWRYWLRLKAFSSEGAPVRVKKTRQNKTGAGFDPIKAGKAPACQPAFVIWQSVTSRSTIALLGVGQIGNDIEMVLARHGFVAGLHTGSAPCVGHRL